MNEEIACVEEVATGNLNITLNAKHMMRQDEVGDLTRAIDQLLTDLRKMIGDINSSTNMLIHASDILEKASQQTFIGMDHVMGAVDTITSEAASQAHNTKMASENIVCMGNLITETDSEAARAGESGKGFAVVAEEIKKLAEQSNEASGNIDQIVNVLLYNSEHVIEVMQKMQEVIERQNQRIVNTEGSVKEVIRQIQSSNQNIRSIEGRTQELEQIRKEVITMITGLSDIAENNVNYTKETRSVIIDISEHFQEVKQSAENLRKTADILEQNIKNFKL